VVSAAVPLDPAWTLDNTTEVPGVLSALSVVDATGLAHGATFFVTTTKGVRFSGMPANAAVKVPVTFWARGGALESVEPTGPILVQLRNSYGGVISQVVVDIHLTWKRHDVMLTWDGSSSAFDVAFLSATEGVDFALYLSHVVCVSQDADQYMSQFPALVPGRPGGGGDPASENYRFAFPGTEQWIAEGEIDVSGVALTANGPGNRAAFLSVWNQLEVRNRRDISAIYATANPEFLLYLPDDTLGSINQPSTGIDWTVPYRIRARWNLAGMVAPETGYGGIRVEGSASLTNYAQTTSWTRNAYRLPDQVIVGGSAAATSRLNGYVSRVTLRTTPRRL
jgi:hypothetical protein